MGGADDGVVDAGHGVAVGVQLGVERGAHGLFGIGLSDERLIEPENIDAEIGDESAQARDSQQ